MFSLSVYYDVYSSDLMIVDDASRPLFSCLHNPGHIMPPTSITKNGDCLFLLCFFSRYTLITTLTKSGFVEDSVLTRLDQMGLQLQGSMILFNEILEATVGLVMTAEL